MSELFHIKLPAPTGVAGPRCDFHRGREPFRRSGYEGDGHDLRACGHFSLSNASIPR
jgi:hypothetical protein